MSAAPSRRARSLALALGGMLLLVLPSAPSFALDSPRTLRDDSGHVLTLPHAARRIVTLAPHLAELVAAAGGTDRLVGVSRYTDHPAAAASLPQVADAMSGNVEAIVRLKPDLVVAWSSGGNPRLRQRLRALGLQVFDSEINTVDGMARTLRQLGVAMGTPAQAEQAAAAVQERWRTLRSHYGGLRPVRTIYQVWSDPLMTVGGQHLISQAIETCGGRNPFARQDALVPTISWEAAARARPEVVFTSAAADEPASLARWQRFSDLPAVRHGRLHVIVGPALTRMSPRFLDATAQMCGLIDAARR